MRFGVCKQTPDYFTKVPDIDHVYVKPPKTKIKPSPLAGKMWTLTASITSEFEITEMVIQTFAQSCQCHILASYCVMAVIFKET